jgi:hypothetical protein
MLPNSRAVAKIFQSLDNCYGDNRGKIRDLELRLKSQSVALFLGAGVSVDANVPDWQGLVRGLIMSLDSRSPRINDLLAEVYFHLNQQTPLILGQQIVDDLGDRFVNELRNVLYNDSKPSRLISAVGALCQRSPLISRLVTYNYDDFVEEEWKKRRLPFNVVKSAKDEIIEGATNIIHIHGYVPRKGKGSPSDEIVLGEGKYYRFCNHPYDWVNIVQFATLFQYHALFIGFSFNDPNVRRLLEISRKQAPKKRHYAVLRKIHADDLARSISHILDLNLDEGEDREKVVRALTEVSSSIDWLYTMQAGLYDRLGLDVLWISDFSDIPELIDGILRAPSD